MVPYRCKTRYWSHALLLGLLPAACNQPQQAAAPAPQPAVGVRLAEMRGINQSFQFVGRIKAVSKVDLRARVEGFLEQVAFRRVRPSRPATSCIRSRRFSFKRSSTRQKQIWPPPKPW